MPLPAILGLPALATFLAGIFSSVVAWFAQWMTRKLALSAALIAALAALYVTFAGAIVAAITAISYQTPEHLNTALSLVVPSNLVPCVAAYWSARLALWVYATSKRGLIVVLGDRI
jgi:ABC-type multidrug transport system permease subunit